MRMDLAAVISECERERISTQNKGRLGAVNMRPIPPNIKPHCIRKKLGFDCNKEKALCHGPKILSPIFGGGDKEAGVLIGMGTYD
jgi:hypothetical protein